MSWIGGLFGFLGNVVSGIFGLKGKQAEATENAVKLVSQIQSDETKAAVAAFQLAIAETKSDSWITRTYRPLIPFVYLCFFVMFSFGYTPQALLMPTIPPIIDQMFNILNTIILIGYPSRTVEKIVKDLSLGTVLKTFIEKRML